MDRSESLWGIPTVNDLPTGLDLHRQRRIRTLGALNESKAGGVVDAKRVMHAQREALSQFARTDRAVAAQQQRMLAARARLASIKLTNAAIGALRHGLMAERHEQVRRDRQAHRKHCQLG